jgi:hypothetical protein
MEGEPIMSYLYELPNATAGIDAITIQMFDSFPFLGALMLLLTFLVVFLGGVTRQTMRSGTADYSAWALIASMATLLPTLLFSIRVGFIQLDWLIIIISINILSAIWFFLDKKPSEV